jgi:hypothetical protein
VPDAVHHCGANSRRLPPAPREGNARFGSGVAVR